MMLAFVAEWSAEHNGNGAHPRGPIMKRLILISGIVSAVLLTLPLASSPAQQKPREKPDKPPKVEAKTSEIMKLKLKHAQRLLEGIALSDFDIIRDNGKDLLALSHKAEWRVFPTPAYLRHSNEFQRAAEKLVESAKEKNIDGATLAYVDMTMNCVRCHKYVREVRMTRGQSGEDRWLAQVEAGKP
jgi:hypothetical protein